MTRRILGLAPALLLLLSPLATLAQEIDPDRLNGTFDFVDDNLGPNNVLEFTIEGDQASATGRVTANLGLDIVQMTYTTIFPTDLKASGSNASVGQRRQVLVEVDVFLEGETEVPAYSGFAAPNDCDASARVRGSNSPSRSDAKLKCDLGKNLGMLEPVPSQEFVDLIGQAFDLRKDVNLNVGGGKLVLKHKGSPTPG